MLDYVLVRTDDSNSIDTQQSDFTKRVQYLGISIDHTVTTLAVPRTKSTSPPALLDIMCRTTIGETSSACTNQQYNIMANEEDDVKILNKELDETLNIIEDTVSELSRMDNGIGAFLGKDNNFGVTTKSRPIRKCSIPQTNKCSGIEKVRKDNRQRESANNSRLESLLDSSFQITDRIMKKAQTMSELVHEDGLHRRLDRNNHRLHKSKSAGMVWRYYKERKRHHRGSNHLDMMENDRIGEAVTVDNDKHRFKSRYSKVKKRRSLGQLQSQKRTNDLNDDSIMKVDETFVDDSEAEESTSRINKVESPISCCFRESEDTYTGIQAIQAHPLEQLMKDRVETSKKKPRRRSGVLSLFDCRKRLDQDENEKECAESDQKSKALNDFINRRRSTSHYRDERNRQEFSENVNSLNYTTRRDSINGSRISELNDTYSSKHRLLQTLRFKKGLISVTTLQKSLASR